MQCHSFNFTSVIGWFLSYSSRRLSIARTAIDNRFCEAEIPFPRIWHRAGSKGSEAPAGSVRVLNRGRKKVRRGLESWPRSGFRRARGSPLPFPHHKVQRESLMTLRDSLPHNDNRLLRLLLTSKVNYDFL